MDPPVPYFQYGVSTGATEVVFRGVRQPDDVLGRVQSSACFIQRGPVIDVGANLAAQFAPGHNLQLVIELTGNHFDLAGVVVEVHLLAGDFEMAGAGEVTGNALFVHNALDAIDRVERGSVHAAGEFATVQ